MAKKSSVNTNLRRRRLVASKAQRRSEIKQKLASKQLPFEERMALVMKLSEMPRNSSATRIRNRCELTGRARGYYRKFRVSRIALREHGSFGLIPGLTKSSW